MKKTAMVLTFACFLLLCAGNESPAAQGSDYSNPNNWMAAPGNADKTIDVFYLYPSAWNGTGSGKTYSDIDDAQMREKAQEILGRTQGMFDHIANIYAPYYRQADAAATLGMSLDGVENIMRAAPGEDAQAAFKYYLEHYNQGRPFILVSHSQGSSAMKVGVIETVFLQEPALLSRMIAAYTIGWTFTSDYLAARGLKFAQGPDDTGVIIAWNTEAPGTTGTNPVVFPGALVINPITWTTSDTYAPASESLGSSIPGYAGSDGQIDPNRGVIINTTMDPTAYDLFPMFPHGVLHAVEWELYFYDVFQNAITRSVSYYSPTYAGYSASLGNGELGDFTRYLRGLLDRNPNPGSVFFHPAHSIFFKLSSQPNAEAFKAEAQKVYSVVTPQASGQAIINLSYIDRASTSVLKKRLGFGAPAEGEVPVSAENCGWSVWAQPFYHSGTQKGDSLRTEIDADYTGVSAGVVKRAGNYAFGLGLHAGRGDLDGSRYDAEVEGLGFGAGVTRRLRAGEVFSPEIALTGGYSHYSLEQTRKIRGDVSPEGAGAYESEPSVPCGTRPFQRETTSR